MSRKLRSAFGAAWLLGLSLAVAACAGDKPPPPPTIVNLTLRASADVNPGPGGNPAPVAVRYYQLTSRASFTGAEFFQLFDQDEATLKTDSVKHEEYVLAPGETKTATVTAEPNVKWFGFFASFRDFQAAAWRGIADVPANKTTNITITAARGGLTVKATPVAGP